MQIKEFNDEARGAHHKGNVVDSANNFDVIDCETCLFKHIIPIPSEEELKKLYEQEFYSTEKPNYFKEVEEDSEWWRYTYNYHYKLMLKNCKKQNPRILDIGSGPGLFVKCGKELNLDVLGLEPSKLAYEYSEKMGLKVVNDFFSEKIAEKYGKFDIVYAKFVVEHLPNPREFIKNIKSALNPDGIICLIAPNDFNPLQDILRKNMGFSPWWVAPPQHINYFNFESIKRLLENSEFEIVECTASFPMEFFLLNGNNYVGNSALGRKCHLRRKLFEINMYKYGSEQLAKLYKSFSDYGIGREFIVIGKLK